jgi:transcriptional regulator with XRE-family HTH domain
MTENRTRDARKHAGLTLGQGARLLDISVVHLSDVELDRAPPTPELLARMADLYAASVDWMTGEVPRIDPEVLASLNARDLPFADRVSLAEVLSLRTTRKP